VIHALSPQGVAVFPADDAYASIWRVAATGNPIVDFALNNDGRTTEAAVTGKFAGKVLGIDTPQGHVDVTLQVLGDHNAHNALAATAAALAAGVSLDAIQRGLEAFGAVKGRLQVKRAAHGALAGATVIDDTYNANPDSMRAAIDVLASQASPRVLVMGDMGEVGDHGPAFHREIGAYAKQRGIDALYALGDASRDACTAYGANAHHVADIGTLVAHLQQAGFGPAATLLVKGSRFMQMERVVDALTSPQSPQPHAAGAAPAAH
jgi:UDP-N-acetylmuramoyl-tripeptide--D-alanyl-D-alanine ligase